VKADDSLTVGLWNIHNNLVAQNTRWAVVSAFLKEYCVDIMFLQEVKAEAKYASQRLFINVPGRNYEYVGIKNEAGIYYDSTKLQMQMIDSKALGVSVLKDFYGRPIDRANFIRGRECTGLFTRRYSDYERQQIGNACIPYSFLVMSYHAVSNAREDVKIHLMNDFFNYAGQLQTRASPDNSPPYPLIIGMDGNLNLNKIDLPNTWAQLLYEGQRRQIDATKKKNHIIDYFVYSGRETITNMWLGSINCIDIGTSCPKTRQEFDRLEPGGDINQLSNHDPMIAYVGFKCPPLN
jgi:exonuclease III